MGLLGGQVPQKPGADDGMVAGVCRAIVEHVAGEIAHHVDVCCGGQVAAKLCNCNREDPAEAIVAEALLAEVAKAGV